MSRRDRIAITVVACAAALAAYWFLALSPKRTEVGRLDGLVKTERTRLQSAQGDIQRYRGAKAAYRENYATVARLGKAVPAGPDVPSLLLQLDSTSRRLNVDFRSLKVDGQAASAAGARNGATAGAPQADAPAGAAGATASFPSLPLNFTFQGSFFKLADFFGRLERYVTAKDGKLDVNGRLLVIEGFSFAPEVSTFPTISAEVKATAYQIGSGQTATGGATPASPAAPSTDSDSTAKPPALTPPTAAARG